MGKMRNSGSQEKTRKLIEIVSCFIIVKIPEYTRSQSRGPSSFHSISHEPCKHCWLARHVSTAFRPVTCPCKVSHCTRSRGLGRDRHLSLNRSGFCIPVHPQVLTYGFSSSCSCSNPSERKYQAQPSSKCHGKNVA